VREDSNRLPRADYDAHSRLCVAPASLNGFLTWRSSNGADSSGIAPIPVRLSLFSSRLLAQFAGERIPDSAERVVDKFLVARAAFTLPKESGNVLGGEVERRTAMQAVQPCL